MDSTLSDLMSLLFATITIAALVVFVAFIYLYYKLGLVQENTERAMDIITLQNNWKVSFMLENKHDPIKQYDHNVLNPFKWTFNSMFPGLSDYEKTMRVIKKSEKPES